MQYFPVGLIDGMVSYAQGPGVVIDSTKPTASQQPERTEILRLRLERDLWPAKADQSLRRVGPRSWDSLVGCGPVLQEDFFIGHPRNAERVGLVGEDLLYGLARIVAAGRRCFRYAEIPAEVPTEVQQRDLVAFAKAGGTLGLEGGDVVVALSAAVTMQFGTY